MQKLKENIEKILKDNLKIPDSEKSDVFSHEGNVSPIIMEKKSQLRLQEERIKQAFLENEAAEKETELKLQTPSISIQSDQDKKESIEDDKNSVIEVGVDNLSQQIVESLMTTLSLDENLLSCNVSRKSDKAFNKDDKDKLISNKNKEIKKLQDGLKFQKQQDRYHIEELQQAVQQERSQTLNIMEKLNEETQSKAELQEELYIIRDEITDLQTQIVRHKDEIEELSSLYEAEKLQTLVLEEALQSEKDNFNRLTKSLEDERKRSHEASERDSDTIMELRTALEIEKEKEARLGMESPYPGGLKSPHKGSKQSLLGSRQSLTHYQGQNQEKVYEDLIQVRSFLSV